MTHGERSLAQIRILEATYSDEKVIGVDCNGTLIKSGDTVEVITPEKLREQAGCYEFCSIGKRGIASKGSCFPIGWVISVTFGNKDECVGCVDYHTKVVD